jgi:hypothetical protein
MADLGQIDLGPKGLAEDFLITTDQWLTVQVGMARLLYGKRMGLDDADYRDATAIARAWLLDVSLTTSTLVEDLRSYGQAHTNKFADDRGAGNVNQLRADLSDLHGMATAMQQRAQQIFGKLAGLAQSCVSLKNNLIDAQMWTDDLDTQLSTLQSIIEKMEGIWGALASDLNELAAITDIGQLSNIMIKVKDKTALREWQTVVDEANAFLANAVKIPQTPQGFGQNFTGREGNSFSAGLCGDMERSLELGEATGWYVAPSGDSFNYIFAADSWQCLTAERDSNTGFLFPKLGNASDTDNQKWQLVRTGGENDTSLFIVSKANGQCLASEADEDGDAHLLTTHLMDRSFDGHSYDSGVTNLRWEVWSN